MSKSKVRRRGVFWVLAVGAVVSALGFAYFYPADIRPEGVRSTTPDASIAGHHELAELRRAHGAERWERYGTMEVVFVDEWPFALTRIALSPWSQPAQRIRSQLIRRSWTTVFELLDGDDAGARWGLQSWKTWTADAGAAPVFDDSWWVEVTVAGLRYFIELPLVQDTATVVMDAGSARWNEKLHERVYVTWERPEPQRIHDQYVLWIDPQSGLLARVDFTIRALAGAAVATATFDDYESYGGVQLPARIIIDAVLPTGHHLPVHTIHIEDVKWDTVAPETLRADPSLPEIGEVKPTPR